MTNLSFPLAEHASRLGCRPGIGVVPRRLGVAAGVVDAVADLDGVRPDPVLRLVKPLHLEALLADGTCRVGRRILRHRDPFHLWLSGPWYRRVSRLLVRRIIDVVSVDDLPRVDPVLFRWVSAWWLPGNSALHEYSHYLPPDPRTSCDAAPASLPRQFAYVRGNASPCAPSSWPFPSRPS